MGGFYCCLLYLSTHNYDGSRFSQHVVSVTDAPKALLDFMVQQTISFGERLSTLRNSSDVIVTVGPQIMLNPFSHSRGGAYPHEPSRQLQEVTEVLIYDVDPNWTFGAGF